MVIADDFQPWSFNLVFQPGLSNPNFLTMKSSTSDPYGVEEFMVENTGVEKSVFGSWG